MSEGVESERVEEERPLEPEAPVPAAPQPSIRRLFKNATLYGAGQTLASLLSLVTDPLLSHLLTRADFGLLGITRTTTNLLTSGYRLGLDGAANRLYFEVEGGAEVAKRKAIGTINAFLLVWVIVLSIGQELFGPAIYARVFHDLPYAPFGRFVSYSLACSTLLTVAQMVWSAQERAKLVAGLRLVMLLVSNAVMFALLYWTSLGVRSIYWAQVAAPTLLLWVHVRFAWGKFGFAWDRSIIKRALAFGLPMVVHSTSHWALDAADRLMLEAYLGREAVGIYTVGYGAMSTLLMVNASINSAYVPQFMRAQGVPEQAPFIARSITYFLLTVLAATLGFVLFAPLAIRTLYAASFEAAAPLSPILALAAPLHAVYLIYVNGLFQGNKTRVIPLLTFTAGVINVGLNAVLIPRIGLLGAALATLAGYAALAILFRLGAQSVAPIPLERGRLLRMAGVFVVVVAAAFSLHNRFGMPAEIVLMTLLALTAPLLLHASGFTTAEERAQVRAWAVSALEKVRS